MNRQSMEEFSGSETVPCNAVNSGLMSPYICQNPEIVQNKECEL